MAHESRFGNDTSGWDMRQVMAMFALLLLAYLVFLVVRPFATALVFAIVMVVVFQPLYVRIDRRLGASFDAALTTLIVAFVIVVAHGGDRRDDCERGGRIGRQCSRAAI